MENYYRFSGKAAPLYCVFFVLGLAAVALLSFVYAIGMYYMPVVQLCVLVTIAFAFLVGLMAKYATIWGKSRNKAVWVASLLVFFAIFVYVHFAAYAAVVYRDTPVIDMEWFWIFITNPSAALFIYTEHLIPRGVWSWGSSSSTSAYNAVSGAPLVGIWVIEHLIILVMPYLSANPFNRPFFEETGRWGVERPCGVTFEHQPATSFDGIRHALETENADYFRALKPVDLYDSRRCEVFCYADPEDAQERLCVNLTNIETTTDKKGNPKTKKKGIVRMIYVSRSFLGRLEAIVKESRDAADAAAKAERAEQIEDAAEMVEIVESAVGIPQAPQTPQIEEDAQMEEETEE